MKQNLKNFFAELAGVDPSQIETSMDDEDFDLTSEQLWNKYHGYKYK